MRSERLLIEFVSILLETKPVYSLSGPSREQGAEPQLLEILLKRLSTACAIPPRSQGMTRIRKAVVAVAGSGTRFLPVTKAMPKEMLPIVDKPIIQLVAEEIVEAGIQDVIFVTKWDKRPLEDHFDPNWALTHELQKAGKDHLLDDIDHLCEQANFVFIRQRGPYGNGTPVLAAESLIGDEPFLYAWGDDLVKSSTSFSKQLVEDYSVHGLPMIGVQEVPREEIPQYELSNCVKEHAKSKTSWRNPRSVRLHPG